MAITPERRALEIAWERHRLCFALDLVATSHTVEAAGWNQALADMALAALVKLGCDGADELKAAQS